jgi:hypothetical protein
VGYLADEHDPESDTPSTLDFFVSTYADTTKHAARTARQCFSNELDVAATNPSRYRSNDMVQQAAWKDPINSRGSAIELLVGGRGTAGGGSGSGSGSGTKAGGAVPSTGILGGVCDAKPLTEAHKAALGFLRATAPAVMLDSGFSDREVAQEGLSNLYNGVVPGDEGLGSSLQPGLDEYLQRKGFRVADVAVARRYLAQEREALDRDVTQVGSGLYGTARPAFHHSGGYYLGKLAAVNGYSLSHQPERYARTGAIQLLDYLRDRANRLLKRAHASDDSELGFDLPMEHRRMLTAASLVAGKMAGERRLQFTVKPGSVFSERPAASLSLTVSGVKEKETIHLLAGRRAYRCLMHGTVDGAPCSLERKVVASNHESTLQGSAPYEDMDRQIAFTDLRVDPAELSTEDEVLTEVYVVSSQEGKQPELLSVIDITQEIEQGMVPAKGEVSGEHVPMALYTAPDDCGDTEQACSLGVPKDIVPPLENEITENSDPYENSWRHYLQLARTAADRADALAEELVRTGLSMDQRAEVARQELEEICGGVLTESPHPVESCDPDSGECTITGTLDVDDYPELYQCLPVEHGGGRVREEFVSLGRKVCLFQWQKSKRICACPDAQANADPPTCTKQCPVAAPSDGDCEALYTELIPEGQWGLPFGDEMETPRFVLVDKTLNVFQSEGDQTIGLANCDKVDALRDWVDFPESAYVIEYLWKDLLESDSWWLNPRTLKRIANRQRAPFGERLLPSLRLQGEW